MPTPEHIPLPRPLEQSLWTRLHYAWSGPWMVVTTVICALGYLASHLVRPTPAVFSWWARAWGRSMLFFMGVRVRLHGAERIDREHSCVFLANHQNALDIPILAAVLPVAFGFVAKADLERVPFLGWALRSSPSVFVDRADPRRSLESIQVAGTQIREGNAVLVFPEGRRSYDGRLAPFMKGAFLLAVESGVPLVPVTLVNAVSVFDESRKVSRPGVVHLQVGDPIPLASLTRRDIPELMRRSREAIAAHLPEEWRNPAPQVG